jgi:hypothetical protein
MTYKAILHFEGKDFPLIWCEYGIERSKDDAGKPSADLCRGQITIVMESTTDYTIYESMASQSPNTGTITFTKDESAVTKELKWENGYIVFLEEGMNEASTMPMMLRFTISAQTLKVGDIELKQNWDDE